jgi:hypothetical protein
MLDLLHSEIDEKERLRERASVVVDGVRGKIGEILKITTEPKLIMENFAKLLSSELAPETTEAVRSGLASAKRRTERLNDKNNRRS